MTSREQCLNEDIFLSETRIENLNYRLAQVHKQLRLEKARLCQLNKKKREVRRRLQACL